MRVLLASAAAVCCLASYAYQGSSIPSTPAVQGVVHGSVLNEAGSGLSGALVELLTGEVGVRRATTDAQGRFSIAGVPPGSYQLRASLDGFILVNGHSLTVGDRPLAAVTLLMRLAPAALSRDKKAQPAAQSEAPAQTTLMDRLGFGARHSIASPAPPPFDTEAYDHIEDNRFKRVANNPVSTFSIDVDTASYSNVRRFLLEGRLPPADAVRTEELINYFRFAYPSAPSHAPFSVTAEVAPCPWNPRNKLALIGLQARRLDAERTPPRNLVFLLDVSGSMTSPDKLPLVRTAMRMLTDTLTDDDRVSIVVYAGSSGLVLPPTSGLRKSVIKHAIAELRPGGSTNGAAGIQLAYNVAASSFIKGGINRVILATDGDFNVGVTSQGELVRLIEQQRQRGVFLSVLGVGTGNLKDSTMEKLADKGNGNYSYLDSLHEARRVLITEAGATLVTVAKDVKIQVEFNPAIVGAYRLIGYENRLLNREDFNDDRKDAGEIGAGHTVTALYELIPAGREIDGALVEPLKYQDEHRPTAGSRSGELMALNLRYKKPDAAASQLVSHVVRAGNAESGSNLGFAAAVAEFGMLLRSSEFKGEATWESARALAQRHRGEDADGYRAEFIRLIELAAALEGEGGVQSLGTRR